MMSRGTGAKDRSAGGKRATPRVVPDGIVSAVSDALRSRGPLVLAVSGGRDSMALMAAVVQAGLAPQVAAVATFDHGSGAAATEAAALVVQAARAIGLPVELRRTDAHLAARAAKAPTEASWRTARLDFLRGVAARHRATLVTAHTRDDQRETVAFRILRQAGARGLAGLAVAGTSLRPLLGVSRDELAAWALARAVTWVEDPTNRDLRHARNRLRLELLPALEAALPGFGVWLDDLGARAAAWRSDIDALAAALDVAPAADLDPSPAAETPGGNPPVDRGSSGTIPRTGVIAAHAVKGYTAKELAVLWPALLARRGVTVDWRGTQRLSGFSTSKAVGSRIPLSGNLEVVRVRDGFIVRSTVVDDDGRERALVPGVRMGRWRFEPRNRGPESWWARLPANRQLTVRAWQDGDRLHQRGIPPRRVARFLADAQIAGPDRAGWPVVLADGVIVWIPGVRGGDAAGPDEPAVEWSGERTVG